jgi:hypothetical protein
MMPPVTIKEYLVQLLGAKTFDQERPGMNLEEWLWESFAFDDQGAHYIRHDSRPSRVAWGEVYR